MAEEIDELLDLALVPLRIAVSKPARRTYIGTLLFLATSLLLYGLAAVAYGLFYFNYVPQISLERVIHLQFGDGHPWGNANLGKSLITQQPYDISVHLLLPRSPPNLAAGNFMLDLFLLPTISSGRATPLTRQDAVVSSRRPAILEYASPFIHRVKTAATLPWHIFGFKSETEALDIMMMEDIQFSRGWNNMPKTVQLQLQADEKMQVYKAVVRFHAKFTGLRWIMYNHRIFSFLAFTTVFWFTEILFTAIAVLSISIYTTPSKPPIKSESGSDSTAIKAELAQDETAFNDNLLPSDLSDTSRTFPTYSRQPPLRYSKPVKEEDEDIARLADSQPFVGEADDEGEEDEEYDDGIVNIGASMKGGRADSGIGTSMEESSERGSIQRRHSRGP